METTSTEGGNQITSQLASLVPTFDPAKDDMRLYQQKVEILVAAWPKARLTELTTRLILNSHGSAFAKLQLHQGELMANEEKSIQRLIEILGGSWGRVGLETQYDDAEQALFNVVQKADESHDSYLARADVAWARLLNRRMSLEELQAYVTLRGSALTPEEKKRVILDADQQSSGKLTMKKVHEAVRLLGATFFLETTGQRKTNRTKVYTQETLMVQDLSEEAEDPTLVASGDWTEDEVADLLAQEGDEDAILIAEFEDAAVEALQDDPSLSTAFSAYQDARRRLSEKARNRGFWGVSKGSATSSQFNNKGKGFGTSKGYNKGKGGSSFNRGRRTLQDRILNSHCRICGRKGHWRAECPQRHASNTNTMSGSANQPAAAPTTSVIPTSDDSSFDALPLEFLQLPEVEATALDKEPNQTNTKPVVSHSFVIYHDTRVDHVFGVYQGDTGKNDQHDHNHDARSRLMSTIHRRMSEPSNAARVQLASRLASRCRAESSMSSQDSQHDMNTKNAWESIRNPVQLNSPETPSITVEDPICFATHGTCGVLDLGASKTVIGSELVPELVKGLQECIPGQVQRCPCRITFRFGNQGTLTSQQAIVVPIGKLMLKIAIVEGRTPFLLSNTLMRALGANIDCKENALHSPLLNQAIPLELTSRGLFLIDVCHLIQQSCTQSHRQK